MHPRTALAAELPPSRGYHGARTTLADLMRHIRAGWILRASLPSLARLIISGNLAPGFTGTGSRARRRILRQLPPMPSDLAHDHATESFRRPSRLSFHD
jgi:hypothetical protein